MKHTPHHPRLHVIVAATTLLTLASTLALLAAGAEVFRDDFNSSSFDTSKWTVAAWTSPQDRTQWGPNPFIPTTQSGYATLKLDTYNPANPGVYLKGTEILTKTQFSLNSGMEFETRLRVNTTSPGIIAAFYTYAQRTGSPTLSDEIDVEIPTKENSPHPAAGDKVYLNNWNDWYSGANASDTTRRSPSLQTIPGLNTNQFNTFTIRWLPDRTEWYVNGTLARSTTQAVPTDPMYLLFNIWAPDSGWTSAYSASLQPTANPDQNVSHTMDLDYAVVRQLSPNTWTRPDSGTWSTPSNWNTPTSPTGPGTPVTFDSLSPSPITVTLDSPKTVGALTFSSPHPYTLTGSPVTLDASSGSATLSTTAGHHTISSPLTLADHTTANIAASSSLTLSSLTAPTFNLTKSTGTGTLKVASLRVNSLSITAGTLQLLPDQPTASKVTSLSPTTGALDLTSAALAIDYTGASPASTIRIRLSQGRTPLGNWSGAAGITSSTAAADPRKLTAIAYLEAADLLSLTGTQTATWLGQTVDASTLLLQYTYYGDANLDLKVDADDLALLDRGFRQRLTGWHNGDFNYDNTIDSNDYLLLDRSYLLFNAQGLQSLGPLLSQRESQFGPQYVSQLLTSIPEPSSLSSILYPLSSLLLLPRRRTQRSAAHSCRNVTPVTNVAPGGQITRTESPQIHNLLTVHPASFNVGTIYCPQGDR